MSSIRWGIISTANIGVKRVIPAIIKSSNGEVAAIASRSLERAQAAADQLNIPRVHGSYEDLLADPEIDAIYNPLPNHLHAEWSIKAAEAGIPTLCEKPLASDAAEAQRMVDAFAEHDVPFAEAFMYRFHPQTARVRELLAAIGDVQVIRASFTFALSDASNIRFQKEMAGGALMDVGCYCVNAMRLLTGEEPDRASAACIEGGSGVDVTLVGTLGFPSGVLGHFDCGLTTFREHSYEIRGSEGRILVPESFVPSPERESVIHHWQGDAYEAISIPPADHYQLMVEDFAAALLDGRPVAFAPQDAVENMRALDRLYEAATWG